MSGISFLSIADHLSGKQRTDQIFQIFLILIGAGQNIAAGDGGHSRSDEIGIEAAVAFGIIPHEGGTGDQAGVLLIIHVMDDAVVHKDVQQLPVAGEIAAVAAGQLAQGQGFLASVIRLKRTAD